MSELSILEGMFRNAPPLTSPVNSEFVVPPVRPKKRRSRTITFTSTVICSETLLYQAVEDFEIFKREFPEASYNPERNQELPEITDIAAENFPLKMMRVSSTILSIMQLPS
jgi:hypothetical protein